MKTALQHLYEALELLLNEEFDVLTDVYRQQRKGVKAEFTLDEVSNQIHSLQTAMAIKWPNHLNNHFVPDPIILH